MKYLTTLFTLFINFTLLSQPFIKGKIIDSETKLPISQVVIILNNNEKNILSDDDGNFKLISNHVQFNLHFKKLGYAEYHLKVEEADTTSLIIVLYKKPYELGEVEIDAEKRVAIMKNKRFYIEDYFILPNQTYLLVTSYIGEKGFNLMMSNNHNNIMITKKIEGEVNGELFLDCMGNIYLLSQTISRQVYLYSDTTFRFLTPVSRQSFDTLVLPCVAKIDNSYFLTKYNHSYTYTREGVDIKVSSNQALVYKIENHKRMPIKNLTYDQATLAMFKNEVKYQNAREEVSKYTGGSYSPYDILVSYNAIYRKIYAPVFAINDTLVIFDMFKKEINFFAKDGKACKTIAIERNDYPLYHKLEFLFDRVTNKIYLLSKQSSHQYVSKINLQTGKLYPPVQLYNDLANKIQVYDNEIYYILKDHIEEDGTSYLFKQKI